MANKLDLKGNILEKALNSTRGKKYKKELLKYLEYIQLLQIPVKQLHLSPWDGVEEAFERFANSQIKGKDYLTNSIVEFFNIIYQVRMAAKQPLKVSVDLVVKYYFKCQFAARWGCFEGIIMKYKDQLKELHDWIEIAEPLQFITVDRNADGTYTSSNSYVTFSTSMVTRMYQQLNLEPETYITPLQLLHSTISYYKHIKKAAPVINVDAFIKGHKRLTRNPKTRY